MRPATSLHIPQPCAESWDAMSPTATGRHCAACAHPVVDFTLKTDAEILAYLAGAAGGRICGRFAAGQLERPLQRAVPVAPAARWRAWLAAAVAVWAVRESMATETQAQVATEWSPRYWGGPVPAARPVGRPQPAPESAASTEPKPQTAFVLPPTGAARVITLGMVSSQPRTAVAVLPAAAPLVLRGVVTDVATNQGLPGVTVLVKGTTVGTSTGGDGSYELAVPPELASAARIVVSVSSVGCITQERVLAVEAASTRQNFTLQWQRMGALVAVSPLPWHPRAFYQWGKYWLTRPFRRY